MALDVLPDESLPIKSSKLLNEWKSNSKLSNRILINPHTSYYSKESFIEMREKAAKNALNIINNKRPNNIIYND